jgi:hypothetical protein
MHTEAKDLSGITGLLARCHSTVLTSKHRFTTVTEAFQHCIASSHGLETMSKIADIFAVVQKTGILLCCKQYTVNVCQVFLDIYITALNSLIPVIRLLVNTIHIAMLHTARFRYRKLLPTAQVL